MEKERKEIIHINGAAILVVMILVGNLLVGALVGRWHQIVVFRTELIEQEDYTDLLANVRSVKNEIVFLERAPNWNSTAYAKLRSYPL